MKIKITCNKCDSDKVFLSTKENIPVINCMDCRSEFGIWVDTKDDRGMFINVSSLEDIKKKIKDKSNEN